jgi:hypothetical protein
MARSLACLTMTCALAGCAVSPTIHWSQSTLRGPEPRDGAIYTLQQALEKAEAQIRDIEKKQRELNEHSTNMSNVMNGLGLFSIGALIGKAHTDVVKAGAFGAGSLYVTENLNSPKTRKAIYDAGIKATVCSMKAVNAVTATTVRSNDDRATAVTQLGNALAELAPAIAAADTALARAGIDNTDLRDKYRRRLEAAIATEGKGKAARDVYAEFRRAQMLGGKELSETLIEIRTTVNNQLEQTIPDPDAVFRALPALFSAMDRAVPRLDLGSVAQRAIDERNKALVSTTPADESGQKSLQPLMRDPMALLRQLDPKQVQVAVDSLDTQFRAMDVAAARADNLATSLLDSLPPKGTTVIGADLLKNCKVSETVLALKFEQPVGGTLTVQLKAGEAPPDATIVLSGGVKPYMPLKSNYPFASLSMASPFDSSMALKIAKDAQATSEDLVLIIQDANPRAPQSVQLKVKLNAPK